MGSSARSAGRARSFGAVAAAYAQYRPDYADAAVRWALEPVVRAPTGPRRLLDLAAGTGKLTAGLVGHGEVIAVEPDQAMLGELRRRLPAVDARAGTAESIPVPSGSMDAVLVGQAWHWFDAERALPEVARVLRPGGVLAALWNLEDFDVGWVAELHRVAEQGRAVPGVPDGGKPPTLAEHPAFGATEYARFPNPVATTTDDLLAGVATHSWALISEPGDRDAAFARIRGYLAAQPETSSGEFVLPMVTDVLRASRR